VLALALLLIGVVGMSAGCSNGAPSSVTAIDAGPLVAPSRNDGGSDAGDAGDASAEPACAPLKVQAEDFDDGKNRDAYSANTPGNGGTSTYRATDMDMSTDGSAIYVTSTLFGTTDYSKEFVRYTVDVATAGWKTIVFRARRSHGLHNGSLVTVVDDLQRGGTAVPVSSTFLGIDGPRHIYLSAGRHVLHFEFGGGAIDFDFFELHCETPPIRPAPRIVSSPLTLDEVVVADAVVTDPPWSADATDGVDATGAIQGAIDTIHDFGGGTVYVPPGVYRIGGNLSISENVTLRGDWQSPRSGTSAVGTLLMAFAGRDNENGAAFLQLAQGNAGVRNLSVWYPEQGFTASTIHAYPYTIATGPGANVVNVRNVTLYDSYNGIAFGKEGYGSASNVVGLYATCLANGIFDDGNAEFSFFTGIQVSSRIWRNAPAVVTGGPRTVTDETALRDYTNGHLTGVITRQADNLTLYDITVEDALQGIWFQKGTPDSYYGALGHVAATVRSEFVNTFVGGYLDTDKIPEAQPFTYVFASGRSPANVTGFYDVRSPPYAAVGDGIADDTRAIQSALDDAGRAGGGTVYLRAGGYRVATHLSVPTGVDLRGPFDLPHTSESMDTAILIGTEGRGTSNPDGATAFITLGARSGLRGLTVFYPDQSPNDVVAYPYTIRSSGEGTWLVNVNVVNGYNIADFATIRSDRFLVQGLWATALHRGVLVGGGSADGRIEQSVISYGNWFQTSHRNGPNMYDLTALATHTYITTESFVLGDCTDLVTFGASSYFVRHHVRTLGTASPAGGAGPRRATFFLTASDSSGGSGFQLEGGDALAFVGLVAAGGPVQEPYLTTTAAFTGTANVYGTLLWAIDKSMRRGGGTVNVFQPSP
jgi:hypothetical protein